MKPLRTFFVLAYGLSWLIWLPLYGPALGLPDLPILPYHHGIGGLGPLLAAFLTTGWYEGSGGVRSLWRRCGQARPVAYLAIALISPFVLGLIAGGLHFVVSGTPFRLGSLFTSREFPELNFLTFFGYNLLFFGYGEEVGWRGFALPRFQDRMSPLWASVVLTVFWALWHWPLFLYRPGYTSMDLAGIAGWVFSLLTGSVLLTWLYNASRGSILICAVFHSTVDVAFTADFADPMVVNYLGALITIWGMFVAIRLGQGKIGQAPVSNNDPWTP